MLVTLLLLDTPNPSDIFRNSLAQASSLLPELLIWYQMRASGNFGASLKVQQYLWALILMHIPLFFIKNTMSNATYGTIAINNHSETLFFFQTQRPGVQSSAIK